MSKRAREQESSCPNKQCSSSFERAEILTTFAYMKVKVLSAITILIFSFILFTSSCKGSKAGGDNRQLSEKQIDSIIENMPLREKIGMMFYVKPECLDTSLVWEEDDDLIAIAMDSVNQTMRDVCANYPVGGILLDSYNVKDSLQLKTFLAQLCALPSAPMICMDEEGGRIARIGKNPNFDVKRYDGALAIGSTGDTSVAYECGKTIGRYLKHFGVDINFAPVADVNTNPDNIVIGDRAFSKDPKIAAGMVTSYLRGLGDAGIIGCLKHFPGHGDTRSDTHFGGAETLKTWEELLDCELITFKAGIEAGAPMVMTAHISVPKVTGSNVPSTMSSLILQEKLRGELGFEGVIVSDALEMGAIAQMYSPEEAAIGCILAGCDIVLYPKDFIRVFDAVVAAVENGIVPQERIDESVRRLLKLRK